MDMDAASNSNSTSTASPDRLTNGRSVSVSLDDPEVRMAAEALGDLRADFVSSPTSRNTPLPARSSAPSRGSRLSPQSPQQEPLFSLLTTSHPLLASTIENATSAYNTSKNFSPRIKTSVEYVEGCLTPIANTVGSVGRVTGVEGGVRWFLGAGRRHRQHQPDLEAEGGSNKRRKVDRGDEMIGVVVDPASGGAFPPVSGTDSPRDSYVFTPDRRLSRASTVETLPAYDDARSPAYTEHDKETGDRSSISSSEMRRSRLMVSTSGLAVAMSNESLRSLKYCLHWLRRANEHIGGVVTNLKTTLEQYEQAGTSAGQEGEAALAAAGGETIDVDGRGGGSEPGSQREDQTVLAARIMVLRAEILRNLQAAIETVSRYAGGALPENARALVHRQLTSLPQRFRYASMVEQQQQQQQQQGPDGSAMPPEERTREGANRVLVLAKEGLDMITQVSGVIDGTIVSAEEWCDKLGTKRRADGESSLPESRIQASGSDTKMG
ncbi:transcription factor Opi1 [Sodiomyces alkalinus F11]|uniref:Transcription factor Opi1 n=1 Tax=Sodiomyces alkalinus (strain CBS 110278 / VKM F-3762 / F11) TaxID=1314773 RepID=A0A3N2PJ74_SODAK|nr:transcription factor Opi1 [Sodiomyces alkalinus F11]ROT34591.1 transcription factor Opi1 [Sodiomyces alkalinus F11]